MKAFRAGRPGDAERHFERARRRALAFRWDDQRRGQMLCMLADFRAAQGHYAEANAFYAEVLDITKRQLEDVSIPMAPLIYFTTVNNMAARAIERKDLALAETVLEQGMSVVRSFAWMLDPVVEAMLSFHRITALTLQKKLSQASAILDVLQQHVLAANTRQDMCENIYRASRAFILLHLGEFHAALAECRMNAIRTLSVITMAEAHFGIGQSVEAATIVQAHLRENQYLAEINALPFDNALLLMGKIHLQRNQVVEAVAYLHRVRQAYVTHELLDNPLCRQTLGEWADLLERHQQTALAQEFRLMSADALRSAVETITHLPRPE